MKIPAIYYDARDFTSGGYAIVRDGDSRDWWIINTSGAHLTELMDNIDDLGYGAFDVCNNSYKHGLFINGAFKTEMVYEDFTTNGVYFFGKVSKDVTDVFDMGGNKIGSFNGTIHYVDGLPLLRIDSGKKCALALGRGEITEYLYDRITLNENSNLAILWSGTMQALAGENGIIFDLGEYEYGEVSGNYAKIKLAGEDIKKYSCVTDATGNVSTSFYDPNHYYGIRDSSDKGVVIVRYNLWGVSLVVDVTTGEAFPTETHDYYGVFEDGTYCLFDGTFCENLEVLGNGGRYQLFQAGGKYGLAFMGVTVSEPVYDTREEAIAAYGFYKIDTENGKPVVVYGNDVGGFTYCIKNYKNNIYFDEIKDVGEGYYACRFDTTWYLLHV